MKRDSELVRVRCFYLSVRQGRCGHQMCVGGGGAAGCIFTVSPQSAVFVNTNKRTDEKLKRRTRSLQIKVTQKSLRLLTEAEVQAGVLGAGGGGACTGYGAGGDAAIFKSTQKTQSVISTHQQLGPQPQNILKCVFKNSDRDINLISE